MRPVCASCINSQLNSTTVLRVVTEKLRATMVWHNQNLDREVGAYFFLSQCGEATLRAAVGLWVRANTSVIVPEFIKCWVLSLKKYKIPNTESPASSPRTIERTGVSE